MSADPPVVFSTADLATLDDVRDLTRWLVTSLGLGSGLFIGFMPVAAVLAATKGQHVTALDHTMLVVGVVMAAVGALAAVWAASRAMTPSLTTWRSLDLKECVGLRALCHAEPEAFFGALAKSPDELRNRIAFHQKARAGILRLHPAGQSETEAVRNAVVAADTNIARYAAAEANFLRLMHLWIARERFLAARRWALAGGAAAVLGSMLATLAYLP